MMKIIDCLLLSLNLLYIHQKDIEIGLSDGIKVEIISGIEMTDKIKIWNKTEPIKIEPEESAFDQFRED